MKQKVGIQNIIKSSLRRLKSNANLIFVFLLVLLVLAFTPISTVLLDNISNASNFVISNVFAQHINGLNELNTNAGSILNSYTYNYDTNTVDGNTGVSTIDPRVLAMKKFLIDYHSPMYTYADIFVTEADKTGLDWRLVASISGVESAFGTLIPGNSNNGWGWRGGPGGAYSLFPTWKEGIQTVTRGLANGYGTSLTPYDIERAYCPPCYANAGHLWAGGVTRFMGELNYYLLNLDSL